MTRHRIALLLGSALLATLTGCSAEPTGGPETSPRPTAVVTTPGASPSSSVPAGSPSTYPTPPGPAELTREQLVAALLRPADLGPGFSVDTSPGANDTSDVYRDCPRLLRATRPGLSAAAERDYRRGDEGPFLTEHLASGSSGEVRTALEALRTAVAGCPQLTLSQEDGEDITLSVRSRAAGAGGVAFSVTATNADFSLDVAAATRGSAIALVTQIGYGGLDTRLTERVLAAGLRRLPR